MRKDNRAEELSQLRRLRFVAVVEAVTLLALVGIGVPIKYLGGYATVVKIMGPVHGVAFVVYFWTMIQTVAGGGWSKSEIVRMLGGAFMPFGGFFNQRVLARRQSAIEKLG
jgi:integral membrane protein